jgi:hypothetical protein
LKVAGLLMKLPLSFCSLNRPGSKTQLRILGPIQCAVAKEPIARQKGTSRIDGNM